jgi:hypothetical protein
MNARRIVRWLIAALLLANSVGAALLWQAWQERHSSHDTAPSAIDRLQDSSDKRQVRAQQLSVSQFDRNGQQSRGTFPTSHP